MTLYSIRTESGTFYNLDTGAKTLTRTPADDGTGKLAFDNEPITYETLLSELTVDAPLRVLWRKDGRPIVRTSTPVTEIVRMDVPPSPD